MELHIGKQPVFIHQMLLEAELEQPVECDVLLPDYCEDIQKILKCTMEPVVTRQEAVERRLELEGICLVTVYYRSPEGQLCRGEYRVPFSKTAELKGTAQNPIVWVQGLCSYINCRAVSSRRLDIRGAAALRVAVSDMCEEQAVCSAGGKGLQLRQTSLNSTRIVQQTCRSLGLVEELELPESKEGVAAVLRVGACARVLDCKTLAGKVILRGEAVVRFLYRSAGGKCETMEVTLPVSQMTDAEGVGEGSRCFARLSVQTATVERCDSQQDDRRVKISLTLNAHLRVHQEYQALCSSDCYSTRYECGCKTRTVALLELTQEVDRTFLYRSRMELPEGVDSITDLWCRVADWKVKREGADAVICGKLCVSLFGCRGGEAPEYYEKLVDFEERVAVGQGEVVFRPSLRVMGQSYSFGGEGCLELRCEVAVSGCAYRCTSQPVICDITLDETKPKQAPAQKGLYICCAEPGEELWEIARRYNTSVDYILEENQLQEGCLEKRTTLLVPVL
jgi:hypothetical protein